MYSNTQQFFMFVFLVIRSFWISSISFKDLLFYKTNVEMWTTICQLIVKKFDQNFKLSDFQIATEKNLFRWLSFKRISSTNLSKTQITDSGILHLFLFLLILFNVQFVVSWQQQKVLKNKMNHLKIEGVLWLRQRTHNQVVVGSNLS